jgi:hypothetical protein
LFVVGGEETLHSGDGIKATAKFLFSTLTWSVQDSMTHARWYPTAVPLADGTLLAVAGNDENGDVSDVEERFTFTNPANQWSIFDARMVNPNPPPPLIEFESDNYPFIFTYHDSGNPKALWAGKRRYTEDIGQPGLRSFTLDITDKVYTQFPEVQEGSTTPREGSGAVMHIDGTATPKKGLVVKVGGNGIELQNPKRFQASDQTWRLNLDVTEAAWERGLNMLEAASDCNMVFLPDGRILVIGGAKFDHDYVQKYPFGVLEVRKTQIYDPVGNSWEQGTDMPYGDFRWYHSAAVLLPDGSVLSAGSNGEFNGRIYYPAYFNQTRPTITLAPTNVTYGVPFELVTTGTVGRVTMIRLGATTHGYDQGQRFIKCDYSGTGTLTVTAPANGAIAPPGYYMIFALSLSSGKWIPSHARYVKVGP